MISAVVEAVLLDLDGPQVMTLRDPVGTTYLALLADRTDGRDVFLCTPISVARLTSVRFGKQDLREVFVQPEVSLLYAARIELPAARPPKLGLQIIDQVPEAWLPEEGFDLQDFLEPIPDAARTLAEHAFVLNRPVVHLNLNPAESIGHHRIDATRLARGVAAFQNLIKHAHSCAVRQLSEAQRVLYGALDSSLLVSTFAPGSFEVHLEAKTSGDLLGHNSLALALEKVDELTQHVADPDATIEVARKYRGHFISAYKNFLQYIEETDTPVRYSWTAPASSVFSGASISPSGASILVERLQATTDLGYEDTTYTGVFTTVRLKSGKWTLTLSDGTDVSGELSESHEVDLHGIEIKTRRYDIKCRETLTEEVGSGRSGKVIVMLERDKGVPLA